MAQWEFLVPNLPVRDVRAAQAWYRDVLGLGVNWLWEDNFGSVGQDHVELFLFHSQRHRLGRPDDESEQPGSVICSIVVDEVDAIYERCRKHGADICSELELKPWNVREFSVRDMDGNMFRIGTAVQDPVPRPEFGYPAEAK